MENNLGNLNVRRGVVLSHIVIVIAIVIVIVDDVGQELIHHLGHIGRNPFYLKIIFRSDNEDKQLIYK